MNVINSRNPISIRVTYTDNNGITVETSFRSLHKASKALSVSIPALKELYHGEIPHLHDDAPKDLKVYRIPTIPKPPPKTINGKYYCEACDKSISPKSKYEHVTTKSHLKNQEKLLKKQQEQVTPQ